MGKYYGDQLTDDRWYGIINVPAEEQEKDYVNVQSCLLGYTAV
jgi:hypothetical protein